MVSHTMNGIFGAVKPLNASEATLVDIVSEKEFRRLISQERKRSERSQRPFVLLLIDTGDSLAGEKDRALLLEMLAALKGATRETDCTGWYKKDTVVGVLFTEIVLDGNLVLSTILGRINSALRDCLGAEHFSRIKFSFFVFPDDSSSDDPDDRKREALYPDLQKRERTTRLGRATKRLIDIAGSLTLVVLLSPVVAVIAAAIRLTSKGPVHFRQERIGQYGKPFTFLKFRTMYIDSDASEHKKYVLDLIAGCAAKQPTNGNGNGNGQGIFKLVNDPRVTPVGRFLRRTSLDELPQLFNVLYGDMSLVGPRPPLPYEVEAYQPWHRRRFLEAKPGITGLWQVRGRSRVGFDEMVRLDLRYARDCSPWLDLKILLQTPGAAFSGDGAC